MLPLEVGPPGNRPPGNMPWPCPKPKGAIWEGLCRGAVDGAGSREDTGASSDRSSGSATMPLGSTSARGRSTAFADLGLQVRNSK